MNCVYVEWIDSETDDGWGKIKDVSDNLTLCRTIGYLIKDSSDFVTIAHSWDEENDHVNGTIQIPKVAIKKKKFVKWEHLKKKATIRSK